MTAKNKTRLIGVVGVLFLIAAVLSPWPASVILLCLAVLISLVLRVVKPKEGDLAAQAAEANDDPDLMTIWEVSDISGEPVKAIPRALEQDGVSRADQQGWRARLPVPMDRIRYRRADVTNWVKARREAPEA